jgi:hypothetical protein
MGPWNDSEEHLIIGIALPGNQIFFYHPERTFHGPSGRPPRATLLFADCVPDVAVKACLLENMDTRPGL